MFFKCFSFYAFSDYRELETERPQCWILEAGSLESNLAPGRLPLQKQLCLGKRWRLFREFVSIPVDRRVLLIQEVQVRAALQNPDPDNTVSLEKVTCDRAGIYSVLRSAGVYSCDAFPS